MRLACLTDCGTATSAAKKKSTDLREQDTRWCRLRFAAQYNLPKTVPIMALSICSVVLKYCWLLALTVCLQTCGCVDCWQEMQQANVNGSGLQLLLGAPVRNQIPQRQVGEQTVHTNAANPSRRRGPFAHLNASCTPPHTHSCVYDYNVCVYCIF